MSELQPLQEDAPKTVPPGTAMSDPFEGTAYRAVARLASGGMGEVFLVEQTRLGKQFAAKVLHANLAEQPHLLERIRVEAETLGSLQHANIVAAFDFQRTRDGRPFVVMEYLKGRTLDDDIDIRGAMSSEEALEFTSQLLSALDAAHELGIVHRDLKPSNLYLCDAASGPRRLKILDFGVARVLPNASVNAPEPSSIPTSSGLVVGTPRYLSPEGAVGKKVDPRADLYAAALMLYIMLTGRGPFDELRRDTAMLAAHAYMDPPPPSQFSVTPIAADLDRIVLKGLSKDPDERYQTATEFQQVVDRYLALLRCPPKLRETSVVGDVLRDDHVEAPEVSRSSPQPPDERNNLGLTLWGSLALFVLVAVVTALVLLTKGQTP